MFFLKTYYSNLKFRIMILLYIIHYILLDKASVRAYKPSTLTENADLFSARTDTAALFKKLANGESVMKGMPF